MCGIVGYIGDHQAAGILIEGLKRLEYRGYDSAGIAVQNESGMEIIKKKGKIKTLRSIVPPDLPGTYGIGHTRWATHGKVNDINAHPHTDTAKKIAVVHNGIIENYTAIKERLEQEGCVFTTETDSEVIAQLIAANFNGCLEKAVRESVSLLKGTYGIACIHVDDPDKIVGARNGSPLVLGIGDDEMYIASDVTAMLAYTKQAIYMEDGEIVTITRDNFTISDSTEKVKSKSIELIGWELDEIEKGGYSHYMEKEIHEQSESVQRAMQGRLDAELATGHLGGLNLTSKELLNIERVKFVAAGTSSYAGLVGAYLMESLARIPASVELSSEVRYKNPLVQRNSLYFAVSQSGETTDTLFAMRELQRKGAPVLGIVNCVGSTIARESDGGVYIHSGPEIAVASTKAFTSQLTVMYIFTLIMARMRNMSYEEGLRIVRNLQKLPGQIEEILAQKEKLNDLAQIYSGAQNFLFLGRGINYPIAMEGALKLKEIAYIHAEGYSAAEIKHGPIALINEETPSMFIIPDDALRDKVVTSLKEVKARNGKAIAIAVEGDNEIAKIADHVFFIPKSDELMHPFLMVVPLQLFAYYCALELKRDVDQPRNLAKSVTVE